MNAALIIIDGLEVKSDAISTLSPERIKSFTVLKDKAAIDAYGEKGKNGVVLITLLTEGEYEFQKNGNLEGLLETYVPHDNQIYYY